MQGPASALHSPRPPTSTFGIGPAKHWTAKHPGSIKSSTSRAAGGPSAMSQHTTKPVSFHNSHQYRLVGTLTLSSKPGLGPGSGPQQQQQGQQRPQQQQQQQQQQRCVILCHGYSSYQDGFHLPAIAAALADAGYNSLRFDFSGNGGSEGPFRFANYIGEVDDIRAAKAYLEQQEGQAVVGLLGHSKGGDDVILYAKLHGDIPLVMNVAGRYDLKDGIEQRFGADIFSRVLHHDEPVMLPAQREDGKSWTWQLTAEDLEERLSLDMAAAAAGVKQVKVLTIHGTADKTIPVEDGRKFAAALPGHRLVEVEGADHNFTGSNDHLQQLLAAVLHFLRTEEFTLPSPQGDDSSGVTSP